MTRFAFSIVFIVCIWGSLGMGDVQFSAHAQSSNPNPEAIMPQEKDWQVTLYDWLETISVSEVTLPDTTISWDGTLSDIDKMADLWLQLQKATVTQVVNSEPDWYVLDAGNGKGIEATGNVRIYHEPDWNSEHRSWSNEPAFLYQLSVPRQDGTEGNPYKGNPALGKRALVVGMVDMIMYMTGGDFADNTDMHGKALLSWVETYRWTKDLLPPEVKSAYEKGMERSLDLIIENGARGLNTNMGTYAIHAAGEIYSSSETPRIRNKAVKAVKRFLLGSADADSVGGPNHKVYSGKDSGVFAPAGYVMEGGNPEVFYNGQSYYHIVGAHSALTDRETGDIPNEWSFLDEVLRRMSEWKAHQQFYDHSIDPYERPLQDERFYTAGAGFSGRTGAGEPKNQGGQGSLVWRNLTAASLYDDTKYLSHKMGARGGDDNASFLLPESEMKSQISNELDFLSNQLNKVNTGTPPVWNGWEPWVKKTVYLPPKGWYSDLQALQDNNDPLTEEPPAGRPSSYNKAFGGPPTGNEFWAYSNTDDNGKKYGFFVEADARQGTYAGWYGGKIETFWTEDTGILIMNRHAKGGCNPEGFHYADSNCFSMIDQMAAQHVWGKDENRHVFTTLLIRGRDLNRTSTFDSDTAPTTVTVNNIFNDPNRGENKWEITDGEMWKNTDILQGSVKVENKFELAPNGLKTTHTLTSDQTDEVKELWATFPVYLRGHRKGSWGWQSQLENTTIEYWTGSEWQSMPDDASLVTTDALRLGRDFKLGDGIQYAYVKFDSPQDVRLANETYSDQYQTRQLFRSVHIDLHGDPGTTKTLPSSKSVSYTVQTTKPWLGDGSLVNIPLQKGANLVSSSVAPEEAPMDSVFAGIHPEVVAVKNEDGERYIPGGDVNEIGQWSSEETYLIYTKSDVTLSIQGESVGSTSIALDAGWNWIPYFPGSPLPVEEALSSVSDALVLLKDETGRVYSPGKGIEVLEQMKPGEGYKIYVNQSTVLNYPDDSN